MSISESLKKEIEKRRSGDIGYQLLTDEEILKEIEIEREAQNKELTKKSQEIKKIKADSRKSGSRSCKPAGECAEARLVHWNEFYNDVWKIERDLRNIPIPVPTKDFNWLIVMLKGMTAGKIIKKMKEYGIEVFGDDDLSGLRSVRKPNQDYAVLVRDRIEADKELKNKSGEDLKENDINCITLEERLMLELFYFWKTKKHLDHNNWTYCAGSRCSGGDVPCVGWDSASGEVAVYWYRTDDRDPVIRARAVVS